MSKKISIKNLYLIGIICIGLTILAVGSTYAMFTAEAEINNPISLASNLTYTSDIIETIDVTVEPVSTKYITLNVTNSTSDTLNYVSWYSSNSSDLEAGRNIDTDITAGTINASSNKSIGVYLRNKSGKTVTVQVGVSSSKDNVILASNMKMISNDGLSIVNLSEYITNMYTNATKTVATNNSINYNYAKDSSLMNDRLGGTTTSLDAGNIRYYGISPNNYIYFNCDDYNNQSASTCELWRIIGVFDGKVKIVRESAIGNYDWDASTKFKNSGYGINDWVQADLMRLLNDGYEDLNVNGSLYYDKKSGTCYSDLEATTTSCDFTSSGIKNATTKNLIYSNLWNIGGSDNHSIYTEESYTKERGTTVINSNRSVDWAGNVALLYPSDYGYAVNFLNCNNRFLLNYSECSNYNYLSDYPGWLLTPNSSVYYNVWASASSNLYQWGNAGGNGLVRPTVYLKADTVMKNGTGKKDHPYEIANPPINVSLDFNRSGKTVNVTITNDDDNFDISSYEYYLASSPSCPTSGYTSSTTNTHTFTINSEGNYFLCARLNNDDSKIISNAFTVSKQYVAITAWKSSEGTYIYSGEVANSWISFRFKVDISSDIDHIEYCTDTSNTCTPNTTITGDSYISSTSYIRYRAVSVFGTKGPIDSFYGRVS